MSEKLSDELALQKANSVDWFDNQASAIGFNKIKKQKTVFKKNRFDVNELSFDELAEKYAETMERLHTYKSTPRELLDIVKDDISGIIKFMVLLKMTMVKIANPEQSLFLKEFENLKKKASAKNVNHENGQLYVEINDLKQKLASCKRKLKGKFDTKHERNEKELRTYLKFKGLVRDRLGDSEYTSLIKKADDLARLEDPTHD